MWHFEKLCSEFLIAVINNRLRLHRQPKDFQILLQTVQLYKDLFSEKKKKKVLLLECSLHSTNFDHQLKCKHFSDSEARF